MTECSVCFRHCSLEEGQIGFCRGRFCKDGDIRARNYGQITSLALDPIEKKPLNRFYPGSMILSVGSYGCNLRCPFCQNYEISWSKQAEQFAETSEYLSPEELAATAVYYRNKGNIGVAYTYNEPLIGYEYVRDAAKLVHEAGLKNVLVTNGTAELPVLEELAPCIDAMNIDLKGFTDQYYEDLLDGNREMVLTFIRRAVQICHVELTTLIIPGENDSEDDMRAMCKWIAALQDADGKPVGADIPLHISRFFPRFQMTDRDATDVSWVYHLVKVAREYLNCVYTGNC